GFWSGRCPWCLSRSKWWLRRRCAMVSSSGYDKEEESMSRAHAPLVLATAAMACALTVSSTAHATAPTSWGVFPAEGMATTFDQGQSFTQLHNPALDACFLIGEGVVVRNNTGTSPCVNGRQIGVILPLPTDASLSTYNQSLWIGSSAYNPGTPA